MKVLQVINSMNTGGAEKLLLETIPKYREQGIEMDLLVLDGNQYPFLKELNDMGVCKIFSSHAESIYNPIHIWKLRKYFYLYDLIHVHLFPSIYWVALGKLVSFTKVPLIFTEHNTTNRRRGSKFFKFIDSIIYNQYNKIVTISKEVENKLINHINISGNKITLILNGVDLDKITNALPYSKAQLKIDENEYLIIQVSSFTEQKDQTTLIKAVSKLKIPYKLILIGEGVTKSNCEKLVNELDLNTTVRFMGIRMDVPRLLKSADLIVLCSKHEGLSLASLEGLASGKPLITSDAPGLSDVVGGAGILVPIGDDTKLATEIQKLLSDNDLYKKTAANCVQRSKAYSIHNMIMEHITLYKEVCRNQN